MVVDSNYSQVINKKENLYDDYQTPAMGIRPCQQCRY